MTADPWSLEQVVRNCSRSGVPYIGAWRHKLGGDAAKASATIRGEGLGVSSLCRGGWFSAPTAEERRNRVADNRVAIEEAALIGAPVLVIVSGPANGQTLDDARATVLDGLMEVLPDAEKAGVVLGVEPLHPMYAAERSVVVTLKQANEIVERLASPVSSNLDRQLDDAKQLEFFRACMDDVGRTIYDLRVTNHSWRRIAKLTGYADAHSAEVQFRKKFNKALDRFRAYHKSRLKPQ